MTRYHIVVTLYGSSAKNAGIVGTVQRTRARWTSDVPSRLVYDIVEDGSQQVFDISARNDSDAFNELTKQFNERNMNNKRPLSGKSYIRHCRVSQ